MVDLRWFGLHLYYVLLHLLEFFIKLLYLQLEIDFVGVVVLLKSTQLFLDFSEFCIFLFGLIPLNLQLQAQPKDNPDEFDKFRLKKCLVPFHLII